MTDPLDAELEDILASNTDPDEKPYDTGTRDLKRAFPHAVRTLANLALYSKSDKIRQMASQFIVEKVIELETLSADDPLAKFMEEVTDFANTRGNKRED
ncbi:MAG TPA: hypothetical protein VG276_06175 [Actinomycetes bacterium]|jgi:hypothetical protein|nr:hypothetical protein [Actinomycetes bacterium]